MPMEFSNMEDSGDLSRSGPGTIASEAIRQWLEEWAHES